MHESQGQNLALTVLYVPHSLDSGWGSGLALRVKAGARGGGAGDVAGDGSGDGPGGGTKKVDRCKATCKREVKLPWREAGPPNHHDDKVVSDQ